MREDPIFKMAVGRAPETGDPLCSQPTMSRLENAPSTTEIARKMAAMLHDRIGHILPHHGSNIRSARILDRDILLPWQIRCLLVEQRCPTGVGRNETLAEKKRPDSSSLPQRPLQRG